MGFQQSLNIKNRRAFYEYEIIEKFDSGIVLVGTEIKSIRLGKVNISDSFCQFENLRELYVINMSISPYSHASHFNHEERRKRKLLLTRMELKKMYKKVTQAGLTIVPLKLYITSKGLAKLNIALVKGKKLHDKREALKEKEIKKSLERVSKLRID